MSRNRDFILTAPMRTEELCRLFHGIDCRVADCAGNAQTAIERSRRYRAANDHDFEGDQADCTLCGEGRCHYLHVQWCDACDQRTYECECECEAA